MDHGRNSVSLFTLSLNVVSDYLAADDPEHAARMEEGLQSLPSDLLRADSEGEEVGIDVDEMWTSSRIRGTFSYPRTQRTQP